MRDGKGNLKFLGREWPLDSRLDFVWDLYWEPEWSAISDLGDFDWDSGWFYCYLYLAECRTLFMVARSNSNT